jgi:hypothetical protein
MAAGTVVISETAHTSVKKIVAAWTSGTDGEAGTASGTTSGAYDGQIVGLTTVPAGGGSAPTDDYDVVVTDSGGHDVLIGAGMNRDTANTEHVTGASMAGAAGSPLTISVTNAGSAKAGAVILWIR